jgi:hypothetical protein
MPSLRGFSRSQSDRTEGTVSASLLPLVLQEQVQNVVLLAHAPYLEHDVKLVPASPGGKRECRLLVSSCL